MIYTGSNQRIPEYHAWTSLCIGMGITTYVELGCGSSHSQRDVGISVITVDILPNGLGGEPAIPHIQGNSHDLETLHQVLTYFNGRPECVFIDADHTYERVKADFDVWYPAATRLIGFHDIRMEGVREFWNEISRQYPSVEIVGRDIASADKWQHGCQTHTGDVNCGGIGVIFKEIE